MYQIVDNIALPTASRTTHTVLPASTLNKVSYEA